MHLRDVFKVLQREIMLTLKKCSFVIETVLGYVVLANGIMIDEEKVKATREWKTPPIKLNC